MLFNALTFVAVARGSCLNPRPPGRGFKPLPRDTANVNACLHFRSLLAVLASEFR